MVKGFTVGSSLYLFPKIKYIGIPIGAKKISSSKKMILLFALKSFFMMSIKQINQHGMKAISSNMKKFSIIFCKKVAL